MEPLRRKHRQKEAFRDDPLLSFRTDRINAAIEHKETSVNALAPRLNVSQQRLQHIAIGRDKRCRRSLLTKIADELGVPMNWLTGDDSSLPFAWYRVAPPDDRENPPRALLAQSRFGSKCDAAFRRDLRSSTGTAARAEAAYVRFSGLFHGAMHDLINPERWRRELCAGLGGPPPPLSSEERDAATVALELAFSMFLREWLNGNALLNYGFLRERGGPRANPGTATETTPLALGQVGKRDRRQDSLGRLEDVVRALVDGQGYTSRDRLIEILCAVCAGVIDYKEARKKELQTALEQFVSRVDPVSIPNALSFAKSLQDYLSRKFPRLRERRQPDKSSKWLRSRSVAGQPVVEVTNGRPGALQRRLTIDVVRKCLQQWKTTCTEAMSNPYELVRETAARDASRFEAALSRLSRSPGSRSPTWKEVVRELTDLRLSSSDLEAERKELVLEILRERRSRTGEANA